MDSHKPDKIGGMLSAKLIGIGLGKCESAAEMSCCETLKTVLERSVGW